MKTLCGRFNGFLAQITCLLILAVPGIAWSQVDQGAIDGVVTDQTGAVIVKAEVTLTSQLTGLSFTSTTSSTGFFKFTPIKIGLYNLTVSAPGFETYIQQGIRVDVSSDVGLKVGLKPGAVSENVTVTSTTELQTEEASTGEVFSTETIDQIPLNGRNYVFAAQLTTGAAAPNQGFTQVAGAGDFTSNGSRVSQNNFILDGVDNNANMQDFLNGATYAMLPPPDALAEFKVESSDYSAELGRSTGAALNASIRSGTNDFHGKLWEYLQNDRLDAADYFDTTGKTAYHQNQFGGQLGGPFYRNKLFFFADSQVTLISSFVPASPNNTVPTDLERAGDFTEQLDPANTVGFGAIPLYLPGGNSTPAAGAPELPGVTQRYLTCNGRRNVICSPNPVATAVLQLFPKPNQGPTGQVFNNYTIPATAASNNATHYDARLDYNPSAKDQVFGRYSYTNNPRLFAPPLGVLDGGGFGSSGQDTNYIKSGVVSETHFFTTTLSNELRVGFNWLSAAYLQVNSNVNIAAKYGLGGIPFGPDLGGFPEIGFGGYINGIGIPSYMPSAEKQNVLEVIDNVSKQWGRHTVKIGANLQHVRFFGLQPPNATGNEQFNGTYTFDPGNPNIVSGSGVADFLLDTMNNSTLNTVTPTTNLRWYDAAYLQDDWKVTPTLTLNLGLRWEYTQPIEALNNMQANFIGQYANFNQGTGTYLIPVSQRSFPISPVLLTTLATDHIGIQYVSNNSLVNSYFSNYAPRIGAAWAFYPNSVLRAGIGLFYGGQENIGLGLNLANNAPFFVTAGFVPSPDVCQNVNDVVTCPTNGQTLETGFGAAATSAAALANAAGVGTIYANSQNAKTAVTTAYNISFEQAFPHAFTFTLSYQGNQSKHLRASYGANQFKGAFPRGGDGQALQPFHDFNIVNVANEGIGRYDSLQTKLEHKFANGFYMLAGYTWAHCLDDAFGPIGQSQYGGFRNVSLLGFRYDYGDCTQNVANRFTLTPQYQLPFGKGKPFLNHGAFANEIAGGWTTSLTFQAQSGNPVFLTSTNQGSSYPIRISDPYSPGGSANPATQPNFNCAAKTHTIQQWFNPCAFKNPPQAGPVTDPSTNEIDEAIAGTIPFGPRGRQAVYGPGFNKLDASLFKSFAIPVHESSLEFRADAFNVLNHPSFGNPGTNLVGSSNQSINSTRFSGIIPDARVLQLALRLSF
ncbi:MAG TPA: TonB-dependent receptor [Terracidiphilus sp.]|jgi:hypothetical protein